MSDPLELKQYIRTVDDFPILGIKFRDITSLIETPVAFVKTCKELARLTEKFDASMIANIKNTDRVAIVDDLIATGGTAIACAELLTENFGIKPENIVILAVIDLSELGGSKRIEADGYTVETLVKY